MPPGRSDETDDDTPKTRSYVDALLRGNMSPEQLANLRAEIAAGDEAAPMPPAAPLPRGAPYQDGGRASTMPPASRGDAGTMPPSSRGHAGMPPSSRQPPNTRASAIRPPAQPPSSHGARRGAG